MFYQLVDLISSKAGKAKKRPFIIGLSGFGGSGKSTLAIKIKETIGDAEIVSIDCFVKDHLSERSEDWQGFDCLRLLKEVLKPAHEGKPITYGVYDWAQNTVNERCNVSETKFLIVEGCSIFHPDLLQYYNFSIWIDVPLEEATRRGVQRDQAQGANWDDRWLNVWMPNERNFFEKYKPKDFADFLYITDE